VSEMDTILRWN